MLYSFYTSSVSPDLTIAEIFCGWLILPTCALPAADVAVEKVWAPSLSKIKYGVK